MLDIPPESQVDHFRALPSVRGKSSGDSILSEELMQARLLPG
jgi:hypothetical protein